MLGNAKLKVLFLDIDGVLNSHQYKFKYGLRNGHIMFPEHIEVLKYIIDNVKDLKIVISSTWRHNHSLDYFKEFFVNFGISMSVVYDKTPSMSSIRGEEIEEWLKHNEVESFAILDDDSDMGHLIDNLIQTNGNYDLTYYEASSVICLLNGWYVLKGQKDFPKWCKDKIWYNGHKLIEKG